MIFHLCMVKHRGTDSFIRPAIAARDRNEAVANFVNEIIRSGSSLQEHPAEYDLYLLGEIDDQSGAVRGDRPIVWFRGKDVVRSAESH